MNLVPCTVIENGFEFRYAEDGLDEVCCDSCSVHLERMDTGFWSLILTRDGKRCHVKIASRTGRAEVNAIAEIDP